MSADWRKRGLQVFAFAAVAVLIDFALGGLLGTLTPYADPRSSPIGTLEAARKRSDAEFVVLGSSRANHHIDPQILGERLGVEVHNAGLDGQSVVFARAVQELMWASGIRPKAFIMQVEAFDVINYEPSRAMVTTRYLDSMPVTRRRLESEGYNVRAKLTSRAFRFNSLVLQLVLNRLRGERDMGIDSYSILTASMEGRRARAIGVPGQWTSPSRTVHPEALRALEEFVEATTAAGSQVFVVTGPYLRYGPPVQEELMAIAAIAEVTAAGGGQLLKIDERRFPVFEDPALFAGTAHLNGDGATIFTEILADLIQSKGHTGSAAGPAGAAGESTMDDVDAEEDR